MSSTPPSEAQTDLTEFSTASQTPPQHTDCEATADDARPPSGKTYQVGLDALTSDGSWHGVVPSPWSATSGTEETRFDAETVAGLHRLIARMKQADTLYDWSLILEDHLKFGNRKVGENVAIYNLGSAHDCVNLGTERCQVPAESCYAHRDEHLYNHPLSYRRRQEYLWDCLDANTFARAFLALINRKDHDIEYLRVNESGDFRHKSDVIRMDRVAEILATHEITVYTYTASSFIDFPPVDDRTLVVNASNADIPHADQRFIAVEDETQIPDDGFRCPYPETGTQCGDCLACLTPDGDGDVYEVIRERPH